MIRALVLVTVLAASGLAEDESTHRRSSSIKQAASSRRDFALGPDDTEGQYCTDHGCDIPGSTISNPRTSDAAESEGFELDTVSDSSAQQWDVFSTIQDTLTSVKDTLLFNAYTKPLEFGKRVYNKATEYAEKVRTIFREEFSNFLEVIWETGVGTDPKSDSLYQRFQRAVVHKILAIGLIIFCLAVSYIIWQFSYGICTSIPLILGFISSVLLMYNILGPEWVYRMIWKVLGYTWYILSFMWTYPFTSAVLIVALFIFSFYRHYFERYERAQRREREMRMLEDIDRRLRRMEERQEEILTLLRTNN